jgi:hypothetical protein
MADVCWRAMIVEVLTRDFKFSSLGAVERRKRSFLNYILSGALEVLSTSYLQSIGLLDVTDSFGFIPQVLRCMLS